MEVLTDLVNQTIWTLYKHMEFFEYEYDVSIEVATPQEDSSCIIVKGVLLSALGAILDSLWVDDSEGFSKPSASPAPNKEKRREENIDKMKQAYDEMVKEQNTIKNE